MNKLAFRFRLAMVALVGLAGLIGPAGLVGCRKPPTMIVKRRRAPVHYGTQYEEMLQRTDRPLLHGAFAHLVETLDEPVAVLRAEDRATTWEVFFATNRELIGSTAASDQQRFGNQLASAPHFGRAEIMIPFRRRGDDPRRQPTPEPASRHDSVTSTATKAVTPDPLQFDSVRAVSWQELSTGVNQQLARSRQQDLLLFVHGFNVDFESALIRTAQVALDMPFNGAVVSYAWPSQGGVQNYENDERINARSVEPFAQFIQQLLSDVPAGTRVNIVVHSMGSRTVMQALGMLQPPAHKRLAHVVFCAPDVGRQDFERWAPDVLAQAERVTLYASTGDSALIVSKSLHREQRAGDSHPPVLVPGIETIDVSAADFNFLGHSYYGSNVDVLADLFRALKERRGPETCTYLTRQELQGQTFWYFSDYGDVLNWTWNFDETIRR